MNIFPSMLAANPMALGDAMTAMERAGADGLHWDIMDGHFVPNLTFGPHVVAAARRQTALFFDVHLMIQPLSPYLEAFVRAGANAVTVHHEAFDNSADIEACLAWIRQQGCKAGVAIKPATSIEVVRPWLEALDHVLVMTVEPGFGGQAFRPECLDKIRFLRSLAESRTLDIQVDGGINTETIAQVQAAGATTAIAGSAVFCASDAGAVSPLMQLRQRCERPQPLAGRIA